MFFEGVFGRIFKVYELSQDNSKRRGLYYYFYFNIVVVIFKVLCERLGLDFCRVLDLYEMLFVDFCVGILEFYIKGWGICGVFELLGNFVYMGDFLFGELVLKLNKKFDFVVIMFIVLVEKWKLVVQCFRDEGIFLFLKVIILEVEIEYMNYQLVFGFIIKFNLFDQDGVLGKVDEDKEEWFGFFDIVVLLYVFMEKLVGF